MTDGATDLINLWAMPDDAYKALKELVPDHDLCQLYEAEWGTGIKKGPRTLERFADAETTVMGYICKFTDAIWDAVMEARGGKTKQPVTPPPSLAEVQVPVHQQDPPINW